MSGSQHTLPSGGAAPTPAGIGAAPALLGAPEPGRRWFSTSDPFNVTLLAGLSVGDRFTYPAGHASAGETYRWSGSTWVLEGIVTKPAAASAMLSAPSSVGEWTDVTLGTSVTHGSTVHCSVRLEAYGTIARMRGRLLAQADRASTDVLATVPAGFRPGWQLRFPGRSLIANVTGNTVTIGTDGTILWGTTLSATAELPLDGVTWPV